MRIYLTPASGQLSDITKPHEQCQQKKKELIQRIALAALKEFAVSLAFAAATALFVVSPVSLALLGLSVILLPLFNAAVRGYEALLDYDLFLMEGHNSEDIQIIRQATLDMIKYTQILCPTMFAAFDNSTRDLVTHECGHALAALALYQNPQPRITLEPFSGGGGNTNFYIDKLTKWGEMLGAQNARLVVSAAGPAFSIFSAAINVGLSHRYRKTRPELSRYLLVMAITSVASHVIYALSALISANSSNDFVRLWIGGVHPVVAAITMIAIPILVKVALLTSEAIRARFHPTRPEPLTVSLV